MILNLKGKEVLPYLAQTYQQLYVVPGQQGSEKAYKDIVLRGQDAPSGSLSHFVMNDRDRIEIMDTQAGTVQVVTLHERKDFEMFLHVMANKCVPYDVPATQGASILDGLVNWQKIRKHKEEWLKDGAEFPDWGEEFRRFTADGKNYKDALILLTAGPYSNIPASALGLDGEEWLERSYTIRKYHECTHFICRRKYPDQIDAVWDEVVADAAGIIAAFGRFDVQMEKIFFGIDENGYTGGRLENYMEDKESLDRTAEKICKVLADIDGLYETNRDRSLFEFVDILEAKQHKWWPVRA